MEKSQIETDYKQILNGTNRLEKMLLLLLTCLLYLCYTRFFGFVLMGVCTYPISWIYYQHRADVAVFAGTAVIHLLVFEITYWFWNDRKQELENIKLALSFINHHLKI